MPRGGGRPLIVLAIIWLLCAPGAGRGAGRSERSSRQSPDRAAFQRALAGGDYEAASELLEGDLRPSSLLPAAARRGDAAGVAWLLAQGADATSHSAARALSHAKDPATREVLLKAGADPDAPDVWGITLLMKAATRGGRRQFKSLLSLGADVNASSRAGRTPLMFSIEGERLMNLRRLLRSGAEVDARDRDGWSALALAARAGAAEIVAELLAAGADPDSTGRLGWTPMILAAWQGHSDVLEALLAAGADPNLAGYASGNALIRAIQRGRLEIAARLLQAGARPDLELQSVDAPSWARLLSDEPLLELLAEYE